MLIFRGEALILFLLALLSFWGGQPIAMSPNAPIAVVLQLRDGWELQSSSKVTETAEMLSSKTFQPRGWYQAKIPSTVLAAQVAAGEFPDPYFGMNLRKIPGTTYPIGHLFSNLPMDK